MRPSEKGTRSVERRPVRRRAARAAPNPAPAHRATKAKTAMADRRSGARSSRSLSATSLARSSTSTSAPCSPLPRRSTARSRPRTRAAPPSCAARTSRGVSPITSPSLAPRSRRASRRPHDLRARLGVAAVAAEQKRAPQAGGRQLAAPAPASDVSRAESEERVVARAGSARDHSRCRSGCTPARALDRRARRGSGRGRSRSRLPSHRACAARWECLDRPRPRARARAIARSVIPSSAHLAQLGDRLRRVCSALPSARLPAPPLRVRVPSRSKSSALMRRRRRARRSGWWARPWRREVEIVADGVDAAQHLEQVAAEP